MITYCCRMTVQPGRGHSTNLFSGQVVVVETEDDHFLGLVDVDEEGWIRVRSGFRGHPHLIDPDDVVSISLASEHPLSE
jgi:hypothetical protein